MSKLSKEFLKNLNCFGIFFEIFKNSTTICSPDKISTVGIKGYFGGKCNLFHFDFCPTYRSEFCQWSSCQQNSSKNSSRNSWLNFLAPLCLLSSHSSPSEWQLFSFTLVPHFHFLHTESFSFCGFFGTKFIIPCICRKKLPFVYN